MDHINCVAGTPQCDEAMTWLHELTKFTQLYVDHKGRHSADTSEIMWREVDPSAFTFSGGITDEGLDCTIGALRDFYAGFSAEAVAQGKLFLTRSGVGLTSLFRACAVPFIGGISGTTAQYLKQFAGTLGAENVTPKMLATLMANMVVGGQPPLALRNVRDGAALPQALHPAGRGARHPALRGRRPPRAADRLLSRGGAPPV